MNKTKIEWCDSTVNPVIGCTFGCKYCYAKNLNNRFRWVEDLTEPQFRPEQLKKLSSKKPQIIFMDSMSDIADWREEWKDKVFIAMQENPQHHYLFLSKRPEATPYLNGAWNGCSITKECEMSRFNHLPAFTRRFVSIEPILEDLQPEKHNLLFKQVHWVIIGAETGNRKGKTTPQKAWVDRIVEHCKAEGVPVFMKNSLIPVMGETNMLREFPTELRGGKADG